MENQDQKKLQSAPPYIDQNVDSKMQDIKIASDI